MEANDSKDRAYSDKAIDEKKTNRSYGRLKFMNETVVDAVVELFPHLANFQREMFFLFCYCNLCVHIISCVRELVS